MVKGTSPKDEKCWVLSEGEGFLISSKEKI